MALTERRRLYEVLVRFDESGLPAAHQQFIEEVVTDEGVVRHATIQGAEPLDPASVRGIMEAAHSAMLAENFRLASEATIKDARIATLEEENARMRARLGPDPVQPTPAEAQA